ncbi:hypothetical protein G20c_15 [Thermus phage G20c]|nr:hypothetical protein G20c_15 [Thermus phage G20c]
METLDLLAPLHDLPHFVSYKGSLEEIGGYLLANPDAREVVLELVEAIGELLPEAKVTIYLSPWCGQKCVFIFVQNPWYGPYFSLVYDKLNEHLRLKDLQSCVWLTTDYTAPEE